MERALKLRLFFFCLKINLDHSFVSLDESIKIRTMSQIVETVKKVKVAIKEAKTLVETNERQTIVHCKHFLNAGDGIRIWKTTFLIEKPSGKKIKLMHAENITMYPTWTVMDKSGNYNFTLYFEGLSKGCTGFDMVEVIPQPGGFIVSDIARNNADVYRALITE